MLWAFEPVKYWRAAPHTPSVITRRSTCRPRSVRTEVLVSPRAMTSSTPGRATNRSITGTGSSDATRMSMSPIVSAMRRSDPA